MKFTRILALLLACCMLSGCMGWMDGSYSSVTPHTDRRPQPGDYDTEVTNYTELRDALVDMVEAGRETVLLYISDIEEKTVREFMTRAMRYITVSHPIGAYAVEDVTYELGTSGGQSALAVTMQYNKNRTQIRDIHQADTIEAAKELVCEALDACDSQVVMRVTKFQVTDFVQLVEDYANAYPDMVMEIPQLTVSMYPQTGTDRVVEILFTYQNSRDALRAMQGDVGPLFYAAELYLTGNNSDHERYTQLYTFLMERHDYRVETSITPAYSLLIHGVGDSKAFATVFSAMCRQVGLECMVVSGTHNGAPLFWNLIYDGGVYYHVDLLRCNTEGAFRCRTDAQMEGYVWDYSAYPESVDPGPGVTEPVEGSEPTEPVADTEPTDPVATE